jgi:phage terminase small subunit
MGGKGSGGRRVGAGRKRKATVIAFVHGSRQRTGSDSSEASDLAHVDPPEDITPDALSVWRLHAPDAIKAGTLTPLTARSFVQLVCDPEVVYARILKTLETDGWTYMRMGENGKEPKKHPLITDLQNWHRRIDAGHARFCLAPLGKPVVEPAKPVDPFAEFEAHA